MREPVVTQSWMGPYESAWEQPYGPYPKGNDEIAMMTGLGASPSDIFLLDPAFARPDVILSEEVERVAFEDVFVPQVAMEPRLPPQKPIPQGLRQDPKYMQVLAKLAPAAPCLLDMKKLGTPNPEWKVPPKGCQPVWLELHKMIPAEHHVALVHDLAWYIQQRLTKQPPAKKNEGADIGKWLLGLGIAGAIGYVLLSKKK